MSAYNTPELRQLRQAWHAANQALLAHPKAAQHPACWFVYQRQGCSEWRRLAETLELIEIRMIHDDLPHPNNDHEEDSFVDTHSDPRLLKEA